MYYDLLDREIKVKNASGDSVLTAYDPDNNKISVTNGRGYITSYTHDKLNRRAREAKDAKRCLVHDGDGRQADQETNTRAFGDRATRQFLGVLGNFLGACGRRDAGTWRELGLELACVARVRLRPLARA